jgi:hypothetical protein
VSSVTSNTLVGSLPMAAERDENDRDQQRQPSHGTPPRPRRYLANRNRGVPRRLASKLCTE